jgi:uncharacterized membrane protein YdjX (TVP38/TMEM64 family)
VRPFITAFVLVVTLFVVGRLLPVREYTAILADSLVKAGLLGALLYGLAYTPAALLFVPGALLTVGAGFAYGPWWGALLAVPFNAIGSVVVFFLSRTLLRKHVEKWLRPSKRLLALDKILGRYGAKAVVLLRLSPVTPFSILNFAFGLTPIRPRDYLWACALGGIPGCLFYAQIGALLTRATDLQNQSLFSQGKAGTILLIVGSATTLVAVVWLGRLARRAIEQVRAEPTAETAEPELETKA